MRFFNIKINKELTILGKEKSTFVNKSLTTLFEVVHRKPLINYYLETDQEIDKVLNIFIRVNKMGTPLSYSDLCFQSQLLNGRNEMHVNDYVFC